MSKLTYGKGNKKASFIKKEIGIFHIFHNYSNSLNLSLSSDKFSSRTLRIISLGSERKQNLVEAF